MKKDQQNNKSGVFKFSIKKLGAIQEGEFTQKPLTVFCGPSNSGKTWAMYALYAFYETAQEAQFEGAFLPKKLSQLNLEDKNERRDMPLFRERIKRATSYPYFHKALVEDFDSHFHASAELFGSTVFKCICSEEEWLNWIKNGSIPDVFLIPAERNGLHLFFRELSANRADLLHNVAQENVDVNKLLKEARTRYTSPVADYIDWLNDITAQTEIGKFSGEVEFLQKKLAQGRYSVNRQTGDINYKPYSKKRGMPTQMLGLHVSSNSVSSLFGLWFYLVYRAKKGDVLMIEEPELNMHPANQILIAHLLVMLINAGIQVVINTHSDYIVREFNNLILLSEDNSNTLASSLKYDKNVILKSEQVAMYNFDNQTIKPFTYTKGEGFAVKTFDDEIVKQNKISQKIYYKINFKDEE